jgi:glycosyltransferase involved in cell wall biosynthesis
MDKESFFQNLRYVLFRDSSYFYKNVREFNPKLIHAHFGVEGVYALKLAKKLEIPLITTFHGFDATISKKDLLLSKKPAWINYFLFRKQLTEEGNLFICVSDFIRKKVIEQGFPEEKTITHYIGIDTNIKIENNIKKPSYKVILHVARLVEKKGTEYLIRAFHKISSRDKDSKLIIIGDGPLKNSLFKLVRELELQNRVEFLGARPYAEVQEWMSKADIFSLPSVIAKNGDTEGLPMVFLEASIHKTPSIATWHAGIPEVVKHQKTGLLVKEKDINGLSDALITLLKDDNLRIQLGKNAKKFVSENFDIKKQTKKLEEIYKDVL